MKCLRCGYCCKNLWVAIVDDPSKGPKEDNIIEHLGQGNPCKHLKQIGKLKYECLIHNYKWYKKTPCYHHGQIERSPNDVCRMGEYVLNNRK